MKYIVLDSNVVSYITSITTAIQYIATNNKVGFYKYITGNTIYEIPPFTKSEGTYTIVKVFRYVQNNQNNSFLENYRITNSTNTVVVYSSADLSNLATNTSLNDGLDAKQDKLTAGKNITITESGGTTTIDTIRDLDTLATIESVSEEALTRSADILAINTKHDALEGRVTTNTTDISDLSVIVGNKQDNITASETSKYYRGDKTWQTLNAAAAGARASNWVPSWTEVTGKPTTFTPSDHTHDSLYYQKSELQNNQISARRLQVNFNGVPTSNLGTPTIAEMALFQEQFNNKLEFWDINKLKFETFDGTDWTDITSTIPEVQKERFVGGDVSSNIAIPNGAVQYAITIKAHGYVYLNALYSYWSSNGNHTTVQVWKKQDTNENWVQHTNSTQSVSAWPGHLFLPFDAIPFASTVSAQYFNEVKFIFTPNWAHATNNISLYNFQIWGGYPAGKRNIYVTDHKKNVTFPANLSGKAITGTEYYIGANKLNASHVGARSDTWNPNWSDITGKPIEFNPADHTHPIEDISGLVLALNKKLETISPDTLGNNKILLGKGDNKTVQASDKEIVGTVESNNNVPTNTAVMNYVSGLNLATKVEVNAKQDPLSFSNGLTKTGNNVTANLNNTTNLTDKNNLSLKVSSDSSNNLRVVPEVATTSKFGLIKSGSTGTEVKINSDGVGSVDTYTKLQIDTNFAKKEDLTNIYKFKGSKQKFSDLLLTGNTVGDVWNVIEANGNIPAGTNYAWDGVSNRWEVLGGITDLSNYVTLSVTNALDGRVTTLENDTSRIGHDHNISDIHNLENDLNAKQNKLTQSNNAGNGISIENSTGKISINNTVLTTSSIIEDSKIPNNISRTDHTHIISDITNLQDQLDSKSPMNHTHPEYVYSASDGIEIVDKKIKLTQAKLNEISGKLDTINSGTLTAETILTGTGSTKNVKSSGKTIVTTLGTDDTTVPTSKAVNTALSGKANSTHTHPISQVTGLDDKLNTKLNRTGPDTFDGDLTVTGKIIGHNETKVIYGTQTATTASWTGNAPWLTELYDGLEIDYFLPFAGGSNVTLDLTLKDGSSTGPINCYYRGNATTGSRLNTHLSEGNWGKLKYFINGFGTVTTPVWMLQGTYDSGNTYDRLYYSNAIQVAEPIYRYKWIMRDVDGGWRPLFPTNKTGTTVVSPFAISTAEFMIGSPILQYNTTKTVNTNGTLANLYLSMPIEVRYNINVASLTNYKNVYLKGTIGPRGGFVIDQTTYYVQDLPTVKDNFYYMYMGYMYNTTTIRFDLNHPIYFVNEEGKLCTYVGGVQGPQGAQGPAGNNGAKGDDGKGIVSVTKQSTSGLVDTYNVNYTIGSPTTFTVTNGKDGANGSPGTAATIEVGTITTGAAGTNATITNVGSPSAAKFNFTIPRGSNGTNGTNGAPGKDGIDATIELGTVSTGAAGSNVVITNTGTPTKAKFNFTIPKGDTGTFDSSELNNYLNKVTGGTVSGDLISSGQTTVQNSGVPLYIKRLSNTANIYAGAMFERGTSGTAGVNNQGIGMYFKSNDTAGNMDFVGIIGGRLAVATSGAEVGELVFGPAYAGADPYARSDFRVRARNGSIADAYINGDMFVGTTPAKLATENYVDIKLSTVYKYKGSKQNKSLLPSTGNVTGDVWNVVDADGNTPAGTNYVWDGSTWDALGGTIDLSSYALKSEIPTIPTGMEYVINKNATNGYAGLSSGKIAIGQIPTTASVTSSTTLVPTSNAVYSALSGKANSVHSHIIDDITNLQTELDKKLNKSTFANNTILLGTGNNDTLKTSSKTIVTTLGTVDSTVPTSKAVKNYVDPKITSVNNNINDLYSLATVDISKYYGETYANVRAFTDAMIRFFGEEYGAPANPGIDNRTFIGNGSGTTPSLKYVARVYSSNFTLSFSIYVDTLDGSSMSFTNNALTKTINTYAANNYSFANSSTMKIGGYSATPAKKAWTSIATFENNGKTIYLPYSAGFKIGQRYSVATDYKDSGEQYYFEFTYGAFGTNNENSQALVTHTDHFYPVSILVDPTSIIMSSTSFSNDEWGNPTLYEIS